MRASLVSIIFAASLAASTANAQTKAYDPGASDTEIKIGQTMPYSGPLSNYGTIGKLHAAYFRMINEKGGINGRKINFISLDDSYSPAKTVEQTRKLVEGENVLFTFMSMGTQTQSAVQKYMNAQKVPMLFVATGASKWNDPANFPWTTGWSVSYQRDGRQFGQYVRAKVPDAKIGILRQNDDLGKDYMIGFREGLGPDADKLIVQELTYQTADPTIESQIVALKSAGVNVFFDVTVAKFAAQAIRKMYELDWKPLHLLAGNSSSLSVLEAAGREKAVGIVTTQVYKDATDDTWVNDPAVSEYKAFMKQYYPEGSLVERENAIAYATAPLMVEIIRKAGDNLTRENIMRQATSLRSLELPMMLPGVLINTNANNYSVPSSSRMVRFDGKRWVLLEDKDQ